MHPVSLRPAGKSDEEFLVALHAALFPPGLPPALVRMQYLAQTASYEQNFGATGHQIILGNGAPIGRLWVHRGPQELRLVDIRLLPGASGRGIGTQLIRLLQAEAPPLPLRLSVSATNPAAFRLYQRLGFTVRSDCGMEREMEWAQP